MKTLLLISLLAISHATMAESTTLSFPGKGSLTFGGPKMTKLKETNDAKRYEYSASSAGTADERFSLSVFVEPISCHFGESIKDVTRCFLEKSDSIPGLVVDSRSTRCADNHCEVIYVTQTKLEESKVSQQIHSHTIFVIRGGWIDAHFSVFNPTKDDAPILGQFAQSLTYKE